MATTPVIRASALNLSARQLVELTQSSGARWPDDLINDYLAILSNILVLSESGDEVEDRLDKLEIKVNIIDGKVSALESRVDGLEIRVTANENSISSLDVRVTANENSISSLDVRVTANENSISSLDVRVTDNENAISTINSNLTDHINSNSQHGVTGENVGTEDFCTSLVGGVALLSELVNDAVASAAEITLADIGAAPAAYDQTYTQSVTDLLNDTKAKHNTMLVDLNNAVTQINDLLAKLKIAKQMSNV